MSKPFVVFQSFSDPVLAETIAGKLQEQAVPFELEDTSSPIDPLIIGSDMNADIRIKLQPADFARGHAVLDAYYAPLLASVEPGYYLFDFTDRELEQIVQNPYEWGRFDYLLAQKLLKDRGYDVVPEELEGFKELQLQEMARPESVHRSWIWLGYLMAVCFSPLGIFYGGTLASFKKTLPDGRRIYAYADDVRTHGRRVLVISACLTTLWLLVKLLVPQR
ncbi:MAG TPA: hypothetical protein VGE66_13190 [Chitinophagaceae bacterium]